MYVSKRVPPRGCWLRACVGWCATVLRVVARQSGISPSCIIDYIVLFAVRGIVVHSRKGPETSAHLSSVPARVVISSARAAALAAW